MIDPARETIRLRPYLYTAFAEYNRWGTPPLRAMILEGDVDRGPGEATRA